MGVSRITVVGAVVAATGTVGGIALSSKPLSTPVSAIAKAYSTPAVTNQDAARLAEQATFGATPAVIGRVKELGVAGWLDEQMSTKTSSYSDLSAMAVSNAYCDRNEPGNQLCFRKYRDSLLPAMRFYKNAVEGDDQLRQRVALALFNIMPVSGVKNPNTAGLATYQQIILDNAFGKYSTLLRQVILSGSMGSFLDGNSSTAAAPNENLARELLQLFSMGPVVLRTNGRTQLDKTGAPLPNYTNKDISELARALTGWEPARFAGYSVRDNAGLNFAGELNANPALYDAGPKTILKLTIPAGMSQSDAVDRIVAYLVKHPSTPPNVAKLLIRSLVKSNPSAGYVSRIGEVFRRSSGDLGATVRAILTDTEARTYSAGGSAGKLKDPILLATSLARLTGARSDGYAFTVRDVQMGQQFLRAPTIFGHYPADFPLAGRPGYVSPASRLLSVGSIAARHNFVWQWTMSGSDPRAEFTTPSWIPGATGMREDWSAWEALGDDVDGMIDRINLVMLASSMTSEQRSALKNAMMLVNDPTPQLRARKRAQTGVYIVASSPQFQIDR